MSVVESKSSTQATLGENPQIKVLAVLEERQCKTLAHCEASCAAARVMIMKFLHVRSPQSELEIAERGLQDSCCLRPSKAGLLCSLDSSGVVCEKCCFMVRARSTIVD
eukprot:5027971-Amphidinium_carterae.2